MPRSSLSIAREMREKAGCLLLSMGGRLYGVLDPEDAYIHREDRPWHYWLALGLANGDETRIHKRKGVWCVKTTTKTKKK